VKQVHPIRPARLPYDYEDYAALPADGRRWELIDGDFEVNAAPSPRHQTVSRRLQYELMRVLEEPGIAQVFNAPIDLILSPHDVLQPDLVLVSAARQHLISDRGVEGVPDICVEILSPHTRVLDQRVKKTTYARYLVPEYWLVEPVGGHVELFRLASDGYQLHQRFDRASRLQTPSFGEVDIDLGHVFRP
jgi:Uma2 family endonuclease